MPYQSILAQSAAIKDLRKPGARPASPVMLQSSRPCGMVPPGSVATASVNHSGRNGESERITANVVSRRQSGESLSPFVRMRRER